MISTGITIKVDRLGRIVIPKELRRQLDIDTGTSLEIILEDDIIIVRKYKANQACIITGEVSPENKEYIKGKYFSPNGIEI